MFKSVHPLAAGPWSGGAPAQPRCRRRRSLGALFLALSLVTGLAPTVDAQDFLLWDEIAVTNPFSVTMAMRGITGAQGLVIRFEGYVGFNDGSGNQFVRHQTGDIATSMTIPLDAVAGAVAPESTPLGTFFCPACGSPIEFPNQLAKPDLDNHCCSNNAQGHSDDRVNTGVSIFGVQSAEMEVSAGGAVNFFAIPSGYSPWIFLSPETTAGPFGYKVSVTLPAAGSGATLSTRPLPGGSYSALSIQNACSGVDTNYHLGAARAPGRNAIYISCHTTLDTLRLYRYQLDDSGGLQSQSHVDLVSGLPPTSPSFVYNSAAACNFSSTGEHTVTGVQVQNVGSNTTDLYFPIFDAAGQLVGQTSTSMPGIRPDKPALGCRSIHNGSSYQSTFVWHGRGESSGTDTRVYRIGGTPKTPRLIQIQNVSTGEATVWASFSNGGLDPGEDLHLERTSFPVAKVLSGSADGEGLGSVRYGVIRVPLFFDTFEAGDFTFWSSSVGVVTADSRDPG